MAWRGNPAEVFVPILLLPLLVPLGASQGLAGSTAGRTACHPALGPACAGGPSPVPGCRCREEAGGLWEAPAARMNHIVVAGSCLQGSRASGGGCSTDITISSLPPPPPWPWAHVGGRGRLAGAAAAGGPPPSTPRLGQGGEERVNGLAGRSAGWEWPLVGGGCGWDMGGAAAGAPHVRRALSQRAGGAGAHPPLPRASSS